MVSGFWDVFRGFGLPLTEEETKEINARRSETGELKQLSAGESPGLIFLQYGKN